MLNKYIEKRITDKITILNILLDIRSIELDELSTLTSLQSKSLLSILQELQETFEEELTFNLDTQQVQLIEHHSHQTNYYFHQLYNQSTILKILRFFLLQGNQSFNEFTQKEYISIATGYRVRQKCGLLLRSVGLDLVKNQVVGPEYRIRFLIALLQFHFGIEIYDLNDGSMDWVTHMIVQSNSQLSHELLEITPDEYVHFSILVALKWKRREFPLEFPESKEFEKLKNLFMYPILMEHCQTYLEPHANMTFTQEELDYIFLVYCSANSSFSKDKWNQEKKTHTIQLILQHTRGKHLLSKFKNILGNDISNSLSFLTALTFLTRTFLFGLQNLVPYYNYYEHYGIESDKPLYHISKAIVQEWMTEQKIEGVIDQHRLYLFSLYLTETIPSSPRNISVSFLSRLIFPSLISFSFSALILFNNSLAGSSLGFCGTNFPSIALWRILALSCSGVIICPPTTAKYQLIHYQSYDLKLLFPLDNSESTQRDLRFPLPLLESHTGLNYNSTQPIH